MYRFKRRVDSFIHFDSCCVTNTDQLAFRIKEPAAASPVNGPTKNVVLERAIVSGEILDRRIPDRGIVAVITPQ